MTQSQVTLIFAALAILVTAVQLFRQSALGGKAMLAVFLSTSSIAGLLYWSLTPP